MDITAMTVIFLLLGCGIGYPVMVFAKNRGPIPWLMVPLVGYSIPLFTIDMCFTIAKPSPVPPVFLLLDLLII